MAGTDNSALICDFAETYHILDYRALPLSLAAVLACGLRENSRIKMKLAGMKVPTETALLAASLDRLSMLLWSKTKDAEKSRNRPKSVLDTLMRGSNDTSELQTFDTAEELEEARRRILEKGGKANGA